MISYNKIALMALIGSVLLTAVLAKTDVPQQDIVGQAGEAVTATQDAAQGAASSFYGFGRGIFDSIRSTGNSIISHIPYIGRTVNGIKSRIGKPTSAPNQAQNSTKTADQTDSAEGTTSPAATTTTTTTEAPKQEEVAEDEQQQQQQQQEPAAEAQQEKAQEPEQQQQQEPAAEQQQQQQQDQQEPAVEQQQEPAAAAAVAEQQQEQQVEKPEAVPAATVQQ